MNKQEIGIHAGQIWRELSESGICSLDFLKRKTAMNDAELSAALGWLAREDKIEFITNEEGVCVFLPVGFMF